MMHISDIKSNRRYCLSTLQAVQFSDTLQVTIRGIPNAILLTGILLASRTPGRKSKGVFV